MAKKKQQQSDPKAQTLARIKRTEAYAERVRALFAATVNEILALNKTMPTLNEGEMFSFDNESLKKQREVERLLRQLHSVATMAIEKGIRLEWATANAECDKLVQSCFGKNALNTPEFTAWTQRNEAAQAAFISRSERGLNLSQRVWKTCRQLRDEMEVAITVAVGDGTSAASMSRSVRKYLNDPDLMFRRFRYKVGEEIEYDEDGIEIGKKIVWGKKWKKRIKKSDGTVGWIDYDKDSYSDEWTGPGYYKSSAQNAMRVARTETNIAYRRADNERWRQMDFVLGQRVQLSRNHPKKDICDKLAGDYPTDFVFDGWHPQCFCFVTPILMDENEILKMNEAMLRGETYTPRGKRITQYPENFKQWVRDNADNIASARERGTEPYFIRNNAGVIDNILNPGANPAQPKGLPQNAHDLIDHLRTHGNLDESYQGGLSEREIYRKWDSLSENERLQVLERGRYNGMLSTEEDLDFANLYQPTTRDNMLGALQDELENKRLGYNVEDTNHYIIKFKGNDAVVHSFDLEKPLTAAQIKRVEYISANAGLSNYRYWAANDEAKAALMREMGFVEYVNGKVTPESLLESQISELMQKAQRAGRTVQSTAEEIAHRHGAVVTPINFKSRDSIRRKVLSERKNPETPDFEPSELKDAVRNTIVAPRQSLDAIIKELQSSGIFMRYKPQHTELGYVGNIINVRTSQGIIGEIQVNTPAMIYAKEPPEIAKSIIGDDVWEKIHRQTNVAGGLGHKYYEEWRVMSIEEQQSERGQKLLRKSLEYYAIFAKL